MIDLGTSFFRRGPDCPKHDFYATPPRAVEELLKLEHFSENVWEPCCGGGHISEVLTAHGYKVKSTDLVDHGYGQPGFDFLQQKTPVDADIITNPPYVQAQVFTEHALSLLTSGHKAAMFLRLVFLATQARKALFEQYPPARVYVASARFGCAKNGEFKIRPNGELYAPSSVDYAWFIWEYGFTGAPTLHWFN